MRRHIKKILGYLLTITLIFSDLSILAYAEETTGTAENVVTSTETVNSTEEPEIISELTEKRDETTKYFAMSDGTIKACIYPQNVHYFESGKYKEIDNTLVETKEDGKTYYKNKKNDFSVKMPESFTEDYIEFSDENGYIKFKLKGATNKKIEKIEKEQKKKNTDKTVVNNVNDKAIFKSIKGNIDIEYDLSGNKLKETIILYKKTKNSFVFDVRTSAVSAKVNADNSISFSDTEGKELYIIASPYMTDSAGEYSNAVETKLMKSENGYMLTYTPDYEWLSAKEREYPVKIDPTLFQAIYKETVTDTYISNVQTTSAPDIRGKWDVLNIGRRKTQLSSGTQLIKRGLIRFDIPSEIGKNDCIVDAKLDLVHYTVSNAVSVSGVQIDVHELTKSFTESGTWWENQPTFDPIITDYAIVNTNNKFSGSTLSYDSYNITRLVNKWHNGSTNYGIMLKLHDEDTTVTSSKQVYYFAKQSTYYGSVSKFVEITYRNATGLEDYWSYTTQDMGLYGTGYVNNYNGNLVYVHDDVSFNSLINGFTLSHVYNTNLSSTGTGYYGSGWKLNLVQKLEPITVTGNSIVKYVYTDGDGTRHYFVQNSDGKIVDEDGLGYTYANISEGNLNKKITDKNGTILKFDSSNFLRHIIESNGNTINLNYTTRNGADNYLTSITTSSGGNIQLRYDSNYNLTSVIDNAGRTTTYKYTSGNLTEIGYPDNSTLRFEYDTNNHWLKQIKTPDGTKLCYENNNYTGKITVAQLFGTDGTASSQTSFSYSQNQTRVTDSYNRGISYQFDTIGRTTCVYDDEQNIYNQTYNTTVTSGNQIFSNNKLASASNGSVYINNLLTNPVFASGLTVWEKLQDNPNSEITVVSNCGLLTSKTTKITSDTQTLNLIGQSLPTTESGVYTFTGNIRTENVESDYYGAALEVVILGGENDKYIYTDFITGSTDTEINNGFECMSVTVEVGEGEYIDRVTAGLYYASGTVYIDSLQLEKNETSNVINLIDNSSFEIESENNLLSNSMFENDMTNWTSFKQNSSSQISVVSNGGIFNSKTAQITKSTQTIDLIQQNLSISTKGTYTFSGYIKAENVSSQYYGAALEIVVLGGSSDKYCYSNFIAGTTDTQSNNGYRHVSVTVTVEDGEYIDRVTAGLYHASGTVYIDNLKLTKVGMPSGYNSNFSDYMSGCTMTEQYEGNCSYKISAKAESNQHLSKTLLLSGKAGEAYSFGGWAKANSIPTKDNISSFRMGLCFTYTDGTEDWLYSHFNPYVDDWQYTMKTVMAQKDYNSLKVVGEYNKNANCAFFDNVFLYKDTMQSYLYDGKGNLISSTDYASQNETFQYNANNYLASLIAPTGSSYEYLYDSKNNLISARSGEGLAYDVEYDNQGNVISTNTGSHAYSSSVQAGKTYYIRLKYSGKYLTVVNAGTINLSNVIESEFCGGAHQRWKVESSINGYYIISPEHATNMALDVSGASNEENANIHIYQKNGTNAQNYKIAPQSDYTYTITPQSSSDGKLLTVNYDVTSDNVAIYSPKENKASEQEWYFEEVEQNNTEIIDGEMYQFRARHSGKYMDLRGRATDVGTAIQQYTCNYTPAQKFRLNRYENTDYYTLSPLACSNMMLEVSIEPDSNGALYLQLGDDTFSERKLFKFEYNEDNQGFYIIPKINETLALGVKDASLSDETQLIFTTKNATTNRFFIAEKFSDTITSSATYQDNGNYPHTTTDSRGNTTTYTYDTDRGLQTGVTDAKGNTTDYTYNALNDLLESVSSGGSTVSYQYKTNGALKSITTANGTIYNFVYDSFGRTSQILVGNQMLSETIYRDNYSSLVERFNYGNGNYKTYVYDNQDRLISESINGTEISTYVYDKSGNIAKITDHITNVTTTFRYDLIGRAVEMKKTNGQSMNFIYDKFNRLSLSKLLINNIAFSSGYIYGDNTVDGQKTGLIYGVNLNSIQQLAYQYDELSRLKNRTINTTTLYVTEYGYLEGAAANTTTTLVKTIKNGNDTLEYSYDELGNITAVAKNGTVIETYTYDSLGQLTGATYGGNTYTYSYDNGGNITAIKKNDVVIKSYTYGNSEWKDLLTAYNGETITYDEIGNPLTYRNGLNFTWQNGRQLANISQNGNAIATYSYDADGLRTSKTVNGATTEYYWLNGTLYGQKTDNEYIFFLYDENGTAYGFIIQNGTEKSHYYYEFNLQGDIIGIIDSTGTKVVEYTYGAWGDILSVTGTVADTIGQKNPLRYRGYYYDAETGFYYVSSRYYDPEIGRFINADGYVSTGQGVLGYNMFAYCGNNPINRKDPSGQGWITALIITAVVVTVATVVVKIVADNKINKSGANDAEKALAKKDYIAAYQVNKAKTITEEYIDKTYGRENDFDGTQVNAYRHAMWNAVMTDKIGAKKAKKFADAHEQFPNNPVEHMEMDFHNNDLGRRIALEYAGQGYDVFSQKIQEAINNGEAKVIIWDSNIK